MSTEEINVAKAKKHFSEILSRVAYGKKQILITKRGKPMARLIPAENTEMHLCDAQGWLKNEDPFFETIDRIVHERSMHSPRILSETSED
jgi:prevent-host-death family protein